MEKFSDAGSEQIFKPNSGINEEIQTLKDQISNIRDQSELFQDLFQDVDDGQEMRIDYITASNFKQTMV